VDVFEPVVDFEPVTEFEFVVAFVPESVRMYLYLSLNLIF
jgi:hypothetical protein